MRRSVLSAMLTEIERTHENVYITGRLSNKMERATDGEIEILIDTLERYPEFSGLLQAAAFNDTNWNGIVALAIVYDPSLPPAQSINHERFAYINALGHVHNCIKGEVIPDRGWVLSNEGSTTRNKAKRLVAAFIILKTIDEAPSDELIARLLDPMRNDHDETLGVLREHPDATVNQIDFILFGGSSPVFCRSAVMINIISKHSYSISRNNKNIHNKDKGTNYLIDT